MNMNFRITFISIVVFSLAIGCSRPHKEIERQFFEGLEKIDQPEFSEREFIVIIPRIGCLGCISSVEQFLMDRALSDKHRLGFLLIDIISLKTAAIRFGQEVIYAESVLLDTEGAFDFGENMSLYPAILRLQNGRVMSVDYVSPDNPEALDNLITLLE